ncbi:MAG: hypothetical protein ACRD12_09865 [Acidimicrobiales bacterium]
MPLLVALVVLAACSGNGNASSTASPEETVRRSIEAENAGDAPTFLALWTDDGLRSYDAGTRADIESGAAPLGAEQSELRGFEGTRVMGGEATTTAVVAVGMGLYRMRFDLERTRGKWLISGWQFLGPAPPPEGTPVAAVRAVDYAYDADTAAMTSGSFGVAFTNAGQEAHEIAVVAIPPDATKAEAVLALRNVRGIDFAGMPPGYRALGHLAYGDPGQSGTYSLARTLDPGRYAIACFLLVTTGARQGETHVAQGMLTEFRVG